MNEDDGKLADKEKQVKRHWFNRLDQDKKDAIIGPAFEEAHPTNDEKREATKKFDRSHNRL
jgi:hypothetical protein